MTDYTAKAGVAEDEIPRPDHEFKDSCVFECNGVWAWIISAEKACTPEDEVCWPFSSKEEATADLKVKLKEIEECR